MTIAKIISFNIGVELGQIVALIPIVYLIRYWQKHRTYPSFYNAMNTYLIIAGIGLLVFQLMGYFNYH